MREVEDLKSVVKHIKGLKFIHVKCGLDEETPRPPLDEVKRVNFNSFIIYLMNISDYKSWIYKILIIKRGDIKSKLTSPNILWVIVDSVRNYHTDADDRGRIDIIDKLAKRELNLRLL